LPAARRGADLIGLDRDRFAIAAARANAKRMGLERTQFIAMSADEGVRFLLQTGYRPHVLILDPPRAGAANVIDAMVGLKAPSVIYVSCNLSTLVRDLRRLFLRGYQVRSVRGLDFFPNTHHIEIVVSLLLT
jgi:23S rRNA (uracil1939-C5)-methyltransferase